MSKIEEGKVAAIWYTLTIDGGEVVDTNRKGGKPLAFLVGSGNIIAGLEEQLIGKVKDDTLTAVVEAEKAYGLPDPERFQPIPKASLPAEVKLEVGAQLTATAEANGQAQIVRIHEVLEDEVMIDFNHPLAGKELTFEVTVVGVRDASEEEKAHGHPHGPNGHHH
jgi:FKBP-type peptidyl-prolyl cis-trans isomerase SlyD